jgi:hypothetical protein
VKDHLAVATRRADRTSYARMTRGRTHAPSTAMSGRTRSAHGGPDPQPERSAVRRQISVDSQRSSALFPYLVDMLVRDLVGGDDDDGQVVGSDESIAHGHGLMVCVQREECRTGVVLAVVLDLTSVSQEPRFGIWPTAVLVGEPVGGQQSVENGN